MSSIALRDQILAARRAAGDAAYLYMDQPDDLRFKGQRARALRSDSPERVVNAFGVAPSEWQDVPARPYDSGQDGAEITVTRPHRGNHAGTEGPATRDYAGNAIPAMVPLRTVGRAAEAVAHRVEQPDLLLSPAERERVAQGLPAVADGDGGRLTGRRLVANAIINLPFNLFAGGTRSAGRQLDASERAVSGAGLVDELSGDPIGSGITGHGLDDFDGLSQIGTGAGAGAAVRLAERSAAGRAGALRAAADEARAAGDTRRAEAIEARLLRYEDASAGPALASNQEPPPARQKPDYQHPGMTGEIALDELQKWARSEGIRTGSYTSQQVSRHGVPSRYVTVSLEPKGRDRSPGRSLELRAADHPRNVTSALDPSNIDVRQQRNAAGVPLTSPMALREAVIDARRHVLPPRRPGEPYRLELTSPGSDIVPAADHLALKAAIAKSNSAEAPREAPDAPHPDQLRLLANGAGGTAKAGLRTAAHIEALHARYSPEEVRDIYMTSRSDKEFGRLTGIDVDRSDTIARVAKSLGWPSRRELAEMRDTRIALALKGSPNASAIDLARWYRDTHGVEITPANIQKILSNMRADDPDLPRLMHGGYERRGDVKLYAGGGGEPSAMLRTALALARDGHDAASVAQRLRIDPGDAEAMLRRPAEVWRWQEAGLNPAQIARQTGLDPADVAAILDPSPEPPPTSAGRTRTFTADREGHAASIARRKANREAIAPHAPRGDRDPDRRPPITHTFRRFASGIADAARELQSQGLTQVQIADRLGVSVGVVAGHLRRRKGKPDLYSAPHGAGSVNAFAEREERAEGAR